MQVQLKRLNKAVHFEASNDEGNSALFDGAESIGGEGRGMRPMEMLLSSVGACAVFDIISILKKQRQPLEDVQVKVDGDRPTSGQVKPFRAIHITFTLKGAIEPNKAEKAAELAVNKYCSVGATLSSNVKITHEVNLVSV